MASARRGADVVVVGGGLVGTCLAYELVKAGAETILVDRHDSGRATDAGAGILSPETNRDPDDAFFSFGRAAAHHYELLMARLADDGAGDTGYAVTGSLLVAEREGDDPFMEEAVQLITDRLPDLLEELEPDEAVRRFPPLGHVRRALFNPQARRVDGRVLNAALRGAAIARGLRVLEAAVTGLVVDRAGQSVHGVASTVGTVLGDAVVLAGGAWSSEMAISLRANIPISPLKGQIVHLYLPDTDTSVWPIVQPVLGFYLVPWPGGRIACGGTMEAQTGFDDRPTADGLHQLLREGLRTAPGLSQATVAEVRVGSRPATPDDRPVLGPVPGWSNVFMAAGHGAEGLLLGPYSALLVAQIVLGTGPDKDEDQVVAGRVLEACSLQRFGT